MEIWASKWNVTHTHSRTQRKIGTHQCDKKDSAKVSARQSEIGRFKTQSNEWMKERNAHTHTHIGFASFEKCDIKSEKFDAVLCPFACFDCCCYCFWYWIDVNVQRYLCTSRTSAAFFEKNFLIVCIKIETFTKSTLYARITCQFRQRFYIFFFFF